jgi:hypothetical protein
VKQPKPQIRLPDDEGPNPYDSRTGYQPPVWMTWQFWLTIIALGVGFYLTREFLLITAPR